MELRLCLFGGVRWGLNGGTALVTGRVQVGVLLALAERPGAIVSTDALLERLWPTVPPSGRNAVQRHVSALRRQLAELGVEQPRSIIERVGVGYRLSPNLDTDLTDPQNAEWWLEPIVGAEWEPYVGLRLRLNRLTTDQLASWLLTCAGSEPLDEMQQRVAAVSQHVERAAVIDKVLAVAEEAEHAAGIDIARSLSPLEEWFSIDQFRQWRLLLPAPGLEESVFVGHQLQDVYRQVVGLWNVGRSEAALDLLESTASARPDVYRRLCRALVWTSHEDAGLSGQLSQFAEMLVINEAQAERTLVSLDANALALMPDGREVASSELDSSHGPGARLRALRVQFMLDLIDPFSEKSSSIVDEIGRIDLPEAEVERWRFEFVNALRVGEFVTARGLLEQYRDVVQKVWRGVGDDFAPMATASLQRSMDATCRSVFGGAETLFGQFSADPTLLPVAEAGRRLLLNDPREPLAEVDFYRAFGSVRATASEAFELVRDMNAGRPVVSRAESIATGLSSQPRDKQWQFVPVALGVVGERLQRSDISQLAADALRPWESQVVGLWPVDLILGAADDWIARFEAV